MWIDDVGVVYVECWSISDVCCVRVMHVVVIVVIVLLVGDC